MSSLVIFVIVFLVLKGMDHKILKAKTVPIAFIYFLPSIYLSIIVYLGFMPSMAVFMAGVVIIQLIGLYLYIKYNDLIFEKDEIKNYKLAKNSLFLEILVFIGIYLMVYFAEKDFYILSLLIIFTFSICSFYFCRKKESIMVDKIIDTKILVAVLVIINILIRQGLKIFTTGYLFMDIAYLIYRYIKTKDLEI